MTANDIKACFARVDAELHRDARSGQKISLSAKPSWAVTETDLDWEERWREIKRVEAQQTQEERRNQQQDKLRRAHHSEIIVKVIYVVEERPPGVIRKDPEQTWKRQSYASALTETSARLRFRGPKETSAGRVVWYRRVLHKKRWSATYELGPPVHF